MPDSLCSIIASSLKKNAGFPWKVITSRLWHNNFFFCAIRIMWNCWSTNHRVDPPEPIFKFFTINASRSFCLTLTFCHHSIITRGYAILKGAYPAGMNEKYRIRSLLIGCVRLVYLVYVQYTGSCKPFPSRPERPIENYMHRAICHGPSTK